MQLFIVFVILALAIAYTFWRVIRTLRGRGDCGCGRGHKCPYKNQHIDHCCNNCQHCHGTRTSIVLLFLAIATATQANTNHNVASQLARDIRLLPYTELHHLVILHNGQIITDAHALPYRNIDPHNQYSACKMLTSLAVGLAVDDGKLHLDDRVIDLFPNQSPLDQWPEIEAMTVRNLLTMTSGKEVATAIRDTSSNWVTAWLALPQHMPGRHMLYDTMTSFMLSAIVQQVTGRNILDLLNERILQPIGITDMEWEQSPDKINTGGWGLRCSTLSMAKIGLLMLQHGQWGGHQLISTQWIEQMTTDQLTQFGIEATHTDEFHDGYGYQMWLCALPGSYRAQGNLGQLILVYPSDQIVIAVNCATPYQGEVLRLAQRYAPQLASIAGPQPVSLPAFDMNGHEWNGDSMHIELPDNNHDIKTLDVVRCNKQLMLTIGYDDGKSEHIPVGYGQWVYSKLRHTPPYNIGAMNRFSGMFRGFSVAARYSCHIGDKIEIWLQFVDWGTGLRLMIDRKIGSVTIIENKSPNRPEVLSINKSPLDTRASSKWWIVIFALIFVTLITLIACNKPNQGHGTNENNEGLDNNY